MAKGYPSRSKGSNYGNRSVRSFQASRSSRAIGVDAVKRAPIAKTHEQWLSAPNRFDLSEVDLPAEDSVSAPVSLPPKPKQIWRLRNIYTMSEEELQDYLNKLDRIRAFRTTPYDARIREENRAVSQALKDIRKARKEKVVDAAKNNNLTFESTPEDNPFYYHQGGSYYSSLSSEEYQENENYKIVSPFIEAKKDTNEMCDRLEKLGYPHDSEVVFSNLVKYHKERDVDWQKAKHPYDEQNEMWNKTTDYMPEVKNVAERKLVKDGKITDEQIFEEFSHRDRKIVKVALDRVSKEEGWVKENGKIKLEATDGKQKPKTDGLKILDNLGAFQEVKYGQDERREILLQIENGKAKTKFMDPSRVAMFDGEVDVSDIPGIANSKGKIVLSLPSGGDEIALGSPDYAYISGKDNDGEKIVLKKYDVKQTRTWKAYDENYNRIQKKEEKKVTKKFIINKRKATDMDIEKQENLPTPRFQTTSSFIILAKDLKELTKPERRGKENYDEAIKIFTDKNKAILVRFPKKIEHKAYYQHGPTETYYETKPVKPMTIKGDSLDTEKRTRGVFSAQYLQELAKLAEPNEKIKISYATDMPLEAKLNNKTVKGSFFLAPRIETD
ncbi:MAG: hypothetical protein PHS34_09200 [Candidatus Omnitrophica bacterium]|nr:hypothetical protein [Candidatus Omnitrophota bacterium]